MKDAPPLVEVRNVSYGYNDKETLFHNVNLSINQNDFYLLTGPNGTGKTTFFYLLLSFLTPKKGEILFLGEKIKKKVGEIGYVPQKSHISSLPIKVIDIVATSFVSSKTILSFGYKNFRLKALEMLHLLGLENLENKLFSELSGGQVQKVLLARALASPKKLLLLDESLANVDKESKDFFYQTLLEINKTRTIILISHDMLFFSQHKGKVFYLSGQNFHYFETISQMEQTFFHHMHDQSHKENHLC
jgi:zinc transport system ATP-binding protein